MAGDEVGTAPRFSSAAQPISWAPLGAQRLLSVLAALWPLRHLPGRSGGRGRPRYAPPGEASPARGNRTIRRIFHKMKFTQPTSYS